MKEMGNSQSSSRWSVVEGQEIISGRFKNDNKYFLINFTIIKRIKDEVKLYRVRDERV